MTYKQLEYLLSKHKSMWEWIAEKILEAEKCVSIPALKQEYIEEFEIEPYRSEVLCNSSCYLCYICSILSEIYAVSSDDICLLCKTFIYSFNPHNFVRLPGCLNGLYRAALFESENYLNQHHFAMMIANSQFDLKKLEQMFGVDKTE